MADVSVSSPSATAAVGRILVADDDPESRVVLTAVLQRAGFTAVALDSGNHVLATLRAEECDVVIADIGMPGNASLEMVRELGQWSEAPPVVLVTGQPSLETALAAVRLRVFDYLLKPVDGDRLVEVVRAGVASRRMLQVMRAHREKLREALAEIDRCEEVARTGSGTASNTALVTFLGVAVQQSLATIADIGSLAEAVVGADRQGEVSRRLQTAKPLALVDAIRETVQVLELTKGSFKSRELGELRRKLEALLGSRRNG